ncbi:MAG TPA: CPBP family intramembrane glutamic endopeptidase [Chlamydiales bacterium]|nr:CPBP family intramembrane glutamic endopeptidase [Chlamydiales bacterium]
MKWSFFVILAVIVVLAVWKMNGRTEAQPPIVSAPAIEEIVIHEQTLVAQNNSFESGYSNQAFAKPDFSQPNSIIPRSSKSPILAATFGIVPGLGHVYLNDLKTASALAGSAGASLGLYFGTNEQVHSSGVIGLETTGFYSIYSAYRDARLQNGQLAYSYCMPTESLSDLVYAPFQWSVIKKPEVWGGIVATLGLAVSALYLSGRAEPASIEKFGTPYLALPIGIGEEAFFRGFLQSALAEHCTPWGAITISSVAFGVAHIRNAFDLPAEDRRGYYTFGIPLLTGLGFYYGWLTHKNHSLKESVAAHTWYNFIVIMTSALIAQRANVGKTGFAVSLPF